jgi:hypothetical protein
VAVPESEDACEKGLDMKTMTCKQLGGPCDTSFQGATADEVIKAQDKHLKKRSPGVTRRTETPCSR